MVKTARAKTIPVQGRLTAAEVEELDRAAAGQSVPVDRSTMISYILRKWLDLNRVPRRRRDKSTALVDDR